LTIDTINYDVHPWLDTAVKWAGVHEILGPRANPKIVEWLRSVGAVSSDETAWCSAFMNGVLREAGYAGTGKANARSWLQYGIGIEVPRFGCLAVLWRGSPTDWRGHILHHVF
jgi:uncharacterized protein (TIGR02594 family)